MDTTVYGIDISHPTATARLMLDHKGIDHDFSTMPPGAQIVVLRARGFHAGTVPALKIDGRKVQTTLAISRELDRIQPDPPLFPADPEKRAAVEEAETWGDRDYQPVPRRIFRWALASDADVRTVVAGILGLPAPRITGAAFIGPGKYFAKTTGCTDGQIEADVRGLRAQLDHVAELLEAGTIGGDDLNAADFQIATTSRVLLRLDPVSEWVAGTAAAEHAERVCPGFDVEDVKVKLPPEWLT